MTDDLTMQPAVGHADALRADEPTAVQYVRPRRGRTVLLTLGLIVATGGVVWVTLGRPHAGVGGDAELADAPAPAGAPLRAPRPVKPAPTVGGMDEAAAANADAEAAAGAAETGAAAVALRGTPEGDYVHYPFDALAAFEYDPYLILDAPTDDGAPPEQIPKSIKALDGKRVAIQGFMVPVQMVKDNVRYFLLVRNQMLCCFGVAVGMNEWIYITMGENSNARYVQDVPVMVYGTLHVGEEIRDGMVMSIYRMDGDKMVVRGGF